MPDSESTQKMMHKSMVETSIGCDEGGFMANSSFSHEQLADGHPPTDHFSERLADVLQEVPTTIAGTSALPPSICDLLGLFCAVFHHFWGQVPPSICDLLGLQLRPAAWGDPQSA